MSNETQAKFRYSAFRRWALVVSLSVSLAAFCGGAYATTAATGVNSTGSTDLPIGAGGYSYIDINPSTGVIYFGAPPSSTSGLAWINAKTGAAMFSSAAIGQLATTNVTGTTVTTTGNLTGGAVYASGGHFVTTASDGALVLDAGPSSTSSQSGVWFRADNTLGVHDGSGSGDDGPVYSNLMLVAADGFVGIGVTSPSVTGTKLEVNGNTQVDGAFSISNGARSVSLTYSELSSLLSANCASGYALTATNGTFSCTQASTTSSVSGSVPSCGTSQYVSANGTSFNCKDLPSQAAQIAVPNCPAGSYATGDGTSFSCAKPTLNGGGIPLYVKAFQISGWQQINANVTGTFWGSQSVAAYCLNSTGKAAMQLTGDSDSQDLVNIEQDPVCLSALCMQAWPTDGHPINTYVDGSCNTTNGCTESYMHVQCAFLLPGYAEPTTSYPATQTSTPYKQQ